ncbi:hypothetical protein Tco_0422766 [Tanacetum coccineum]
MTPHHPSISDDAQLNIWGPRAYQGFPFKHIWLDFSSSQNTIFPFSVRLSPIAIVWYGYSRCIATLIPFFSSVVIFEIGSDEDVVIIRHSNSATLLPCKGDGDLTTMNFIQALVDCSLSLSDTRREIFPNGQDISPLNPRSRDVAGIILLLTPGQRRLKQCLYRTSKALPPSTYIRCIKCPLFRLRSP